MGGKCGYLAVMGALAGGADGSYIHEDVVSIEEMQHDVKYFRQKFGINFKKAVLVRNENCSRLYKMPFMQACKFYILHCCEYSNVWVPDIVLCGFWFSALFSSVYSIGEFSELTFETLDLTLSVTGIPNERNTNRRELSDVSPDDSQDHLDAPLFSRHLRQCRSQVHGNVIYPTILLVQCLSRKDTVRQKRISRAETLFLGTSSKGIDQVHWIVYVRYALAAKQ